MSSLADLPELVGFFSYSREDDEDSHGALSVLRERIQRELRGQLGRSMKTFRLWQDKEAIASGTLWEAEIKTAAEQSVFFIPIITPTVVRSPYCRFELESFLAREAVLGRSDLVFPILYIKVPALEDSVQRQNDPILSIIAKRQYLDWREFRHRDVASTDVKEAVERFCAHICDALHRPWLPMEERQRRDEAEARSRAEEEQRQQKEERRREAAAEAERRRLEREAAATREAKERARQAAAAEAERQRQERDEAATREAAEKARQEQRRKNEEDQRQRDKAEAKQRSEQARAFAAAKYDGTVLAMDKFLTAYPDSNLAGDARALRTALVARDEAHKNAVASDDPAVLKAFLASYPKGPASAQVRSQLRRLEPLPSRRAALVTAGVLSVVVVGSVGVWLADRYWTPVTPKQTLVQPSRTTVPPAADAEAKRRADEAEQQRLASLKIEEERADAKRIAEAKANGDAEAKRRAEEAEQQRQAALKAEEERADAKRIAAEAASNDRLASLVRQQQDLKATRDSLDKRMMTELFAPDGKRNDALIASLRAEMARAEQSIDETSARIMKEFPARAEAPALAVTPGSGQSIPCQRFPNILPGICAFRDRLANGQLCPTCPEMIVVPAGSFTMGSPESEPGRHSDESPQHRVTIAKPFAVGRFAVIFDEWDACVADSGCHGYKPGDQGFGRGRRPVADVSWDDAKAYVAWLSSKTGKSYRLLSEAEFEYAARGGSQTARPWGNDLGKGNANCDGCGSQWERKQTAPVGSFAPNAFGLYDMAGNVGEWVEDCYHDNYRGAPTDGSAWTSGDCSERVNRGGHWLMDARGLRSAQRLSQPTDYRFSAYGFRVGRALTP
jgi:formylglycine-generating enzyme required for sulfatase activity